MFLIHFKKVDMTISSKISFNARVIHKTISSSNGFLWWLVNWRALGKNLLNDILGFFLICAQKWLIFCMWPNIIAYVIFGNKKQTSQKYYRTLILLTMLGHMQKVSHFSAQMKKNAKCQLGHFCPEPFDISKSMDTVHHPLHPALPFL